MSSPGSCARRGALRVAWPLVWIWLPLSLAFADEIPASRPQPTPSVGEPVVDAGALGPLRRRVVSELFVVPHRGVAPSPLVASVVALKIPLSSTFALEGRFPFLFRPVGIGSPSLGGAWALYRHRDRAEVLLVAGLRLFGPVASTDGDAGRASAVMRLARPLWAPGWDDTLTVSPSFAMALTTSRYSLWAEGRVPIGAIGDDAPRVSIAYLGALGVRVWGPLTLHAEVAGRVAVHGTSLGADAVGVAVGASVILGVLQLSAKGRFPLRDSGDVSRALVELSLAARF